MSILSYSHLDEVEDVTPDVYNDKIPGSYLRCCNKYLSYSLAIMSRTQSPGEKTKTD